MATRYPESLLVTLNAGQKRTLVELAARDGISMGELIRRLVREHAERQLQTA